MELLLNILWLALAGLASLPVLRKRSRPARREGVPYLTALLAVSCAIVLLFPFISASDDLHPTQAIAEDSSKRAHHGIAASDAGVTLFPVVLLALLGLAVFSPAELAWFTPRRVRAIALDGESLPLFGRAPPARFILGE